MLVTPTNIPDVLVVEPKLFSDERGFFMEVYHTRKMADAGIRGPFVQDNHSGSRRGTLRGLHYQIRHPQGKLMRVVVGEIFDVAVDLRRSSRTFGQWVGVYLSAENRRQLWIPAGFAHGFYVRSEWADVLYKVTDFHAPDSERTVVWNDPQLAIRWPLLGDEPPILSSRDAAGLSFAEAETFD